MVVNSGLLKTWISGEKEGFPYPLKIRSTKDTTYHLIDQARKSYMQSWQEPFNLRWVWVWNNLYWILIGLQRPNTATCHSVKHQEHFSNWLWMEEHKCIPPWTTVAQFSKKTNFSQSANTGMLKAIMRHFVCLWNVKPLRVWKYFQDNILGSITRNAKNLCGKQFWLSYSMNRRNPSAFLDMQDQSSDALER